MRIGIWTMLKKRRSHRLQNFDYSSANSYFITICVLNMECKLGTIKNGIMGFSETGNASCILLQEICEARKNVILDEFIIMPNHIHAIIDINNGKYNPENINKFSRPVPNSVSMIINHFKGSVKKWCINHHLHFELQGRYHDHIIRNREEYWAIKNYIIQNPRKWQMDKFYQL